MTILHIAIGEKRGRIGELRAAPSLSGPMAPPSCLKTLLSDD